MNSLGQVPHNEIEPGVLNDTPSIAEDYMPYARKVFTQPELSLGF